MAIVTTVGDSVPIPSPPETRWQQALRRAVRDPRQLCQLLRLPPELQDQAAQAATQFPLVVPWEYLRRIRTGDPHDPLLRQVLPLADELHPMPGYQLDPVGDVAATIRPGLLQKYAGRALMVATPHCAVHCRYCFRRHFDYAATPRSLRAWQPALDQLARDTTIHEVILSGGDPLLLTDRRLGQLVASLDTIPHLERLRIHTRLPVVIPQRVTDQLVRLLQQTRLTTVFVIHANHPAELDAAVATALAQLTAGGIPLLNQSVLLRGVNDTVDTLVALSRRLVNLRVFPYYLHLLDAVSGAAHFHVPRSIAQQLAIQLAALLPGYAVPRLVCEQPGAPSKVRLV